MIKRLSICLLLIVFVAGCTIEGEVRSTSNPDAKVSLLFEHEGVKVYRFIDGGHYVYYAVKSNGVSTKYEYTEQHGRGNNTTHRVQSETVGE